MDIWLNILYKAKEYGGKGFKPDQIRKDLKLNEEENELFSQSLNYDKTGYIVKGDRKSYLSYAGYIALLEYEQLQQAREAAEDSKRLADESLKKADESIVLAQESLEKAETAIHYTKKAFKIAVAAFIASIIFSIISLLVPAKTILIEDRTMGQVEEKVEKQEVIPLEGVKDSVTTIN